MGYLEVCVRGVYIFYMYTGVYIQMYDRCKYANAVVYSLCIQSEYRGYNMMLLWVLFNGS